MCFVVCVALMVLAGFYDFAITKSLYDANSFYARFFDLFGELPLYAMFPFALCIIAVKFIRLKKPILTALSVVLLLISIATTYICINRFFGSIIGVLLVCLLSLLFIGLLFFTIYKNKDETLNILFRFAVFALCFCAIILFVNQCCKFLWGRWRFYAIMESGDMSNFTNWWQLNDFNLLDDNRKSFYSGHTTSAISLLCLLPLAKMLNIGKNKTRALTVLIAIFVVLVAVSRLIYGSHFLSDVTFAVIVGLVVYLVVYYIFNKKLKFFTLQNRQF